MCKYKDVRGEIVYEWQLWMNSYCFKLHQILHNVMWIGQIISYNMYRWVQESQLQGKEAHTKQNLIALHSNWVMVFRVHQSISSDIFQYHHVDMSLQCILNPKMTSE